MEAKTITIGELRTKRNTRRVAQTLVKLLNRHRTNPARLGLDELEHLIRSEIERRGD